MPRYFTLQQAEQTLPHVKEALHAAIELKAEYQKAGETLRDVTRRIMVSGGIRIRAAGVHRSTTSRTASDHLPVWAEVEVA